MKSQFTFNGRKYITSTKKEGNKFLHFWGDRSAIVRRLKTGWRLNGVERSPCWAPVSIIDESWEHAIEYGPGTPPSLSSIKTK